MSVSMEIIIVVSVVGVSVIGLAALFVCCLWRKHRRKKSIGEYEKILPEHQPIPQLQLDGKSLETPKVSMKTIAFTLPSSAGTTPTSPRRQLGKPLEHGSSADLSDSGGSLTPSELGSPAISMGKLADTPTSCGTVGYSLGAIDPSLYKEFDLDDHTSFPEGHIGRIWFAVEYEREAEKLLVTLIKAKNLPSRVSGSVNGCDPFVRLFLMPDERRYLQSKFKKKTCNPKFDESFGFQVSHKSLEERTLKLTVYDVDRHKRHNLIGHALYPLKESDLLSDDKIVIWRDLERDVQGTASDRGEINVALCYNNHLERLTVGVFEGKSFKALEGCASVDCYIKVVLLVQNKPVKSKKTEVIKRDENPVYNESFTFKLPSTQVDTASVTLTAMQHMHGHRDKQIGRVVLGSFMFARGKELQHWNDMIAHEREQVINWHVLS